MKAYKHIALIATVSFFASCAKNEVVEPIVPVADASQVEHNAGLTTGDMNNTDNSNLDPGSAPGLTVVGITDAPVQ